LRNNYLNKKYEIVVTIKTIITQIERLARSYFSLEFDCKKLGSTNINTPIKLMNSKKAATLWPFFLKSISKLENLKYIRP